jgi:allantoinase
MFMCAPPIRERENREFLWAAVAHGLIHMVVSDHADGRRQANGGFGACGLPSLQFSLPATWTGARTRGYALHQVVDWMCRAPAQLAGLTRKGQIDVGYDADVVVLDADAEFTVEAALLDGLHQRTPYIGRRLWGVVERTYLRGVEVYSRSRVCGPPRGRLLVRGES